MKRKTHYNLTNYLLSWNDVRQLNKQRAVALTVTPPATQTPTPHPYIPSHCFNPFYTRQNYTYTAGSRLAQGRIIKTFYICRNIYKEVYIKEQFLNYPNHRPYRLENLTARRRDLNFVVNQVPLRQFRDHLNYS